MDKIFSPIKARLLQFIEQKDITKESFFAATGVKRANFSGSNAESEIGGEKIIKILTTYPDLNADWLLLGKGSMLRDGGIGHVQNGNSNTIDRSPIHVNTSDEVDRLKSEVKHLEELLAAKDEIINLLKNK